MYFDVVHKRAYNFSARLTTPAERRDYEQGDR